MKSLLVVSVVFVATICAVAQSDLFLSNVTTQSDGSIVVSVTNKYAAPLTAFIVSTDLNPKEGAKESAESFFDVFMNRRHDTPILQRQSASVTVPHRSDIDAGPLHPEVKAVIFADGTVKGDPPWIKKILDMRQHLYRALGEVEKTMNDGLAHGMTRDELVAAVDVSHSKQVKSHDEIDLATAESMAHRLAAENLKRDVNAAQPDLQSSVHAIDRTIDHWRAQLHGSLPAIAGD